MDGSVRLGGLDGFGVSYSRPLIARPQKQNIMVCAFPSHHMEFVIVVVVLLFYVHGKHLRSCRDGHLT